MKKNREKIMDDQQYAILRKNGKSHEEASEISRNHDEHASMNEYHGYTKQELVEEGLKQGIENIEEMNRHSLIEAIEKRKQQR